jgi:hypothetical protein
VAINAVAAPAQAAIASFVKSSMFKDVQQNGFFPSAFPSARQKYEIPVLVGSPS